VGDGRPIEEEPWWNRSSSGPDTVLTAMGELVNTTARLASAAAAGEILIRLSSATTDALDGLERPTRP